MTDNLPPLPEPCAIPAWPYPLFTADQMQAYARAAIDAALAARGAVPAGYTDKVIQELYEQGDPVSVDAAEELKRLQSLLTAPQQVAQPSEADPCPGCVRGGVCRTPSCGRLKLPVDHPLRGGAQAKPEQAAQPLTDEETALDLLAEVFDAYENGTPCYEEPDEHSVFVGNAFILSNETFHACADLLNRRRPVAAAPAAPEQQEPATLTMMKVPNNPATLAQLAAVRPDLIPEICGIAKAPNAQQATCRSANPAAAAPARPDDTCPLVECRATGGCARAAQQAEAQPVAEVIISDDEFDLGLTDDYAFGKLKLPNGRHMLYTAQPKAVPLTHDQIENGAEIGEFDNLGRWQIFEAGVRFAEAAHGIGAPA